MREQKPQIPQANPEIIPETQFEPGQQSFDIIERLRNSRVGVALAIGAIAMGVGSSATSEVSATEQFRSPRSLEKTHDLDRAGIDHQPTLGVTDKINSENINAEYNVLDHKTQNEDSDLLNERLPYTKYEFIIAKFYRLYPSAEGSSWLNHFKRAVFTRSGYVAEAVCGPAKMGLKKYVETYSPTVNTITTYDCRGDKDVWSYSSEEGSLFESPEEVERRMLRAGKDTLKITQIKRDHTKGLEKLVAQPQKQRIKTTFEKSKGGVKSISIQEDKVKKVSHYK